MVEYFVLNAFTVHLLPCAYNAGIIMKRKKKIILETHIILQWKNACHSCNCWKSVTSLLFLTVMFLCICGMHSRGLRLMSHKSAVYNVSSLQGGWCHCKAAVCNLWNTVEILSLEDVGEVAPIFKKSNHHRDDPVSPTSVCSTLQYALFSLTSTT